ncbi:tagaturonate reductase [Marinoscillum furvescens]|uniref:Tagaturonate reductase n=1 Tax=Marinoscillum furvescens DSM 4134 TaxID=1122208 RepID=A0A3D9KYI7_MARFU|nr:tagaturonate reductase [Marinoscillum furvescens]RED92291.1 tagaturonate reductase [Marinoscillum furvescens DSM 4134]
MKTLKRPSDHTPKPVKILQFGEGNFLRAFADWAIYEMNQNGYNAGVAVVQPIDRGLAHMLSAQDGLYHHLVRGLQKGKSVNNTILNDTIEQVINPFEDEAAYFAQAANKDLKIVISNTTEAGIQFQADDAQPSSGLAKTFPGKLTQLLHKRFETFGGSPESGLVLIPCELIEKNGEKLRETLLQYAESWNLGADYADWIKNHNHFANTLVDRIVPGYPKDEIDDIKSRIGYDDQLVVASEVFHLWVIEGNEHVQEAFPAHQHGLNVKYVADLTPYRTQKVRILNGAHTAMVPVGLLAGIETVRENVEDEVIGDFILKIMYEEVAPTIDLPQEDVKQFADEVLERFKNPFVRHELKSISLNSISKYRVRILPTVLDYIQLKQSLPQGFLFALASLIKLYLSDNFEANDDASVLEFFGNLKNTTDNKALAKAVLSNEDFWHQDLTAIEGFEAQVGEYLEAIDNHTIKDLVTKL